MQYQRPNHARSDRIQLASALLLAWLAIPITQAANPPPLNERAQVSGTAWMADLLDDRVAKADPLRLGFMSRERVELLRQTAADPGANHSLEFHVNFATELLNAGETEAALRYLLALERELRQTAPDVFLRLKPALRMPLALAYLRLAEQENCIAHHTSDSCLIPIRDAGIHKDQRGSRAAIGVLSDLLQGTPDNLSARWLLNLAYMTLGEFPQNVPKDWLIPETVFQSEHDIGRFRDVASTVGLDHVNLAGGSVVDDFDRDGLFDVMTSSMGLRDPMRLFRNTGDGTFSDVTEEAGLIGEIGGLNLVHADYNNDGFVDVFVLRGGWMGDEGSFPNSLLRNNGNGTFSDVTQEAGVLSFHPTQTAVWLDYNLDGWLDLFIGNESSSEQEHPCELFRNNRDGTFTECAAQTGVASVGMVKAVASADYNNDGLPDLYLSRHGQDNILFRNDGAVNPQKKSDDWKFTDVTRQAGVGEPLHSFTTWFFDYDNDGWSDLFVVGYRLNELGDIAADYLGKPHSGERARLFHNRGDGTFEDVTRSTGLNKVLLGMGANFGDLDNDGWLDFYIGTGTPNLSMLVPNRMFRNDNGRRFQDVTTSGGFGHVQKGHGVSFADLDHDGDQDVFEVMGGAYPADTYRNVLYENPGHGNHWIALNLIGVQSNRSALGARIEMVTDESRRIFRTVTTGGSFGGSPFRQQIGLGKARQIKNLIVFWPASGKRDSFKNVEPNRAYVIEEGDPKLRPLPLKRLQLGR